MNNLTLRQREALYEGIAAKPLPETDQVIDQFCSSYEQMPHRSTIRLLYDMHRLTSQFARRPLPGIVKAAM